MDETLLSQARVDRTAFSVVTLQEADAEREAYWRNCTSDERFEALELARQIAYGYDPTARRLSRFFEIVDRT